MEYFSQTFFVHSMSKAPVVHVIENPSDNDFPVMLRINSDESFRWTSPSITFHFTSMSQYLKFKNSVIQAHESLIKRQNASD